MLNKSNSDFGPQNMNLSVSAWPHNACNFIAELPCTQLQLFLLRGRKREFSGTRIPTQEFLSELGEPTIEDRSSHILQELREEVQIVQRRNLGAEHFFRTE